METGKKKKRFFAKHAKSSAMVVSLAIHALLIVVALSFVAVTVIQKQDQKFEAKQVSRPKLPPKKLQVPVKVSKKKPTPKLSTRITVKTRMDRNMPDIKMPEISGVKGGIGSAGGGGLGNTGGVGFSIPEIEVFGVRSKGEKVFLALDSDAFIMRDEVGGLPAYAIIKAELEKIIDGLRPTTLFNLAVFTHHTTTLLFPRMVPATRENIAMVEKWLEPLNKVKVGMGADAYGTSTLGPGGTPVVNDFAKGKIYPVEWENSTRYWYTPAALAMEEQADAVFILSGWWGNMRHVTEASRWSQSKWDRWNETVKKARELLAADNAKLVAKGEPPRVLEYDGMLVDAYFPGTEVPDVGKADLYTGRDFAEGLQLLRKESAPKLPTKSGVAKQTKDNFSLNVVFFAPVNTGIPEYDEKNFSELTHLCNGELRVISGLDAIRSSVSTAE